MMKPPPLPLLRIDAENPWLGLAAFTEDAADYFYGRDEEVAELHRRVHSKTLTVLFGQSGLGKTSLLQAGLFPRLRSDGFLPVYVRLDFGADALAPREQIVALLWEALTTAGVVENAEMTSDKSLWEFFHHSDNVLRLPGGQRAVPVLVFDQFEELFTVGRGNPASASALLSELGDLVENRPPTDLDQRIDEGTAGAEAWDFDRTDYRVLLALREEYLPHLENVRGTMPSLTENRMRLTQMNGRQALEAVLRPGGDLVQPEIGEKIVRFVSGGSRDGQMDLARLEIEPSLLSLICRELNKKRRALGHRQITGDLLAGNSDAILQDFYERSLRDQPPAVRAFVEDELLTDSGFRESMALERARKSLAQRGAPPEALDALVDCRLLHIEERLNVRRIELTHDLLVGVVRASRDRRTQEEALQHERGRVMRLHAEHRRERRRLQVAVTLCAVLTAVLLGTVWGVYWFVFAEHSAYYRSFAKQNGFPKGVDRISESEARQLPLSYKLVWKGIRWEKGWFEWKPVHRMLTVPPQPISTYLWSTDEGEDEDYGGISSQENSKESRIEKAADRTKRLGLDNACDYEYVADAMGQIVYQRAFDKNHRMIWGLSYSPRPPASGQNRLTRFVDPDGLPLLQRQSPAEFVEIEYDKNLFESRIRYLDELGQPALGPYHAFGRRIEHDPKGRVTLMLSIDANKTEMVDRTGNCGVREIYDGNGFLREERSVGPDLKPMAINDGWTVARYEHDSLGRVKRLTYYDAADNPVLHRDGYHGWEAKYDEHGNQVSLTLIGLDGKPMLSPDGYAIVRSSYDDLGDVTRRTYHGVVNEPVLHKDGYHGWEAKYDEHGNQVSLTLIGLDGKPMPSPDGYAIVRSSYDLGNVTQRTFYGVANEPVLHKDGYHGWEAKYNERGYQVSLTWIGFDHKPMLSPDGYAITRMSYDARGNLTRRTFYGVANEPVLHKDGYHGWEAKYDERGNEILDTWIGLDDKPMVSGDGYAIVRSSYDDLGNVRRRTFHGVANEPVLHKDGYYGWEAKYDERGNRLSRTWFGLNNKALSNVVVVGEVLPGSAAEFQGVHQGDIILAYTKWSFFPERDLTTSLGQLNSVMKAAKDEPKTVLVWRDGKLLGFDFGPGPVGISPVDAGKPRELVEQIRSAYERRPPGTTHET